MQSAFRVDQNSAEQARGIVVVIDVIRAFTVAGYAFAGGAQELWLVRTIEEAQALHERDPQTLLAGEVRGLSIEGFHFNNSPALIARASLEGKRLIQRTSAGTQGAVGASHAPYLLLSALTNARATAAYARHLVQTTGEPVTLFPTLSRPPDKIEDEICANYIEALLQERDDADHKLAQDLATLQAHGRFDHWKLGHADMPEEDIEAVLAVNRFNFAMVGRRQEWQGITYVQVQRVDLA